MDSDMYLHCEWIIENVSCWRANVHGEYLNCDTDMLCYELYPMGESGLDKRMMFHFPILFPNLTREVHFIAPDGSLILKQQVATGQDNFKVLADLGFEEVKDRIGKMATDFGDRLTIQFYGNQQFLQRRVCTEIEVVDTTFKIDTAELKSDELISDTYYSNHTSQKLRLETLSHALGDERYKFNLEPFGENNRISVETQMSLTNISGALVRYEENEHLFYTNDEWMFSDSLTKLELSEKGIVSLLLRFKIITGEIKTISPMLYAEWVSTVPNDTVCAEKKPSSSQSQVDEPLKEQNIPLKKDNIGVVPNRPLTVLSEELMCLYQDQDFSDFTLKCDGVSIPVHRNILSARSPVFKRMLSTDMTEASSSEVVIGDLDPATLARFLAFLYTGGVEDLQCDRALSLYYAADKYQVLTLKKECADFLCGNVSITNVCDILSLGDSHQDDALTAVAHDFILKNYNEVLSSKEWVKLMNNDPLLTSKTVTQFAQKKCVGRIGTSLP